MTLSSIHFSSEKEDWYTPPWILDLARKVMGSITLDPSSNPFFTTQSEHAFTYLDDGLNREWFGNIYLNCPYGREISSWIEKYNQELKNIEQSFVLLPARTDTKWFHKMNFDTFVLLEGRIKFIDGALLYWKEKQLGKWAVDNWHIFASDAAPFPSMITYTGKNVDVFKEEMSKYGKVLVS